MAKDCLLLERIRLICKEQISSGDLSASVLTSKLNAAGGVSIGSGSLVGPGAKIWSINHRNEDVSEHIRKQGWIAKPVIIEEDVWITANTVILPGVRLGRGAVVAAGAVVTRDVLPFQVVAGVPARQIGQRGHQQAR